MLARIQLTFANLFFSTPRKRVVRQKRPKQPPTSEHALAVIWNKLIITYFPERNELHNYSISWSRRPQKRTLASCNLQDQRVLVARELNHPEHEKWLEPLIYHEMCHAVLGYLPKKNSRRSWHGKEFKQLEKQHPQMAAFDYWVKSGGWRSAIRSDRSRRSAAKRSNSLNSLVRNHQ